MCWCVWNPPGVLVLGCFLSGLDRRNLKLSSIWLPPSRSPRRDSCSGAGGCSLEGWRLSGNNGRIWSVRWKWKGRWGRGGSGGCCKSFLKTHSFRLLYRQLFLFQLYRKCVFVFWNSLVYSVNTYFNQRGFFSKLWYNTRHLSPSFSPGLDAQWISDCLFSRQLPRYNYIGRWQLISVLHNSTSWKCCCRKERHKDRSFKGREGWEDGWLRGPLWDLIITSHTSSKKLASC